MRSRRTAALAAGIVVAALYAGSAVFSGHLSPSARRPLLDGLAPPTPYRWVEPPPELESTNLEPSSGTFRVALGAAGSRTAVFTTDDAQVSLILPRGAFDVAPAQDAVEVTVEPVGPSTVGAPEEPDRIAGNVYRLGATYRPSGDPAPLAIDARVVLVYPLLAGDHGGHELLVSANGRRWRALDTNDLPSVQQADAAVSQLGYVAAASTNRSATVSPSGGAEQGGSTAATVVIVAALIVLVVGAAAALRPWRLR